MVSLSSSAGECHLMIDCNVVHVGCVWVANEAMDAECSVLCYVWPLWHLSAK